MNEYLTICMKKESLFSWKKFIHILRQNNDMA